MKNYLSIFLIAAALGTSSAFAEPSVRSRELLFSVKGEEAVTAQRLLKAIDSGSIEEVRNHIDRLVDDRAVDLVSPLLFDPDDAVVAEAAKALAQQKSRKIAERLVQSLGELDVVVTGGTQALKLRAEAKLAVQKSLINITGMQPPDEWSVSRKIEFFSHAIRNIHDS